MRLPAKISAVACVFALAAVCRPPTAFAVVWTLSGVTFSDGGTASGTFVTTPNGLLVSGSFTTTTVGNFTGATFDYATAVGVNVFEDSFSLTDTAGDEFTVVFDDYLTGFPNPDPINDSLSFEQSHVGNAQRTITAGEADVTAPMSSVPEPMSAVLLGTGLVGLGFCRRYRDLRTA